MRRLLQDLASGVRAFAPSRFPYARFLIALAIGVVGALVFVYLNAPLPWMLGSMTATTILALAGVRIAAPSVVRAPMIIVVGVMVGATFTPDILQRFVEWWPTILGLALFCTVAAAAGFAFLRAFSEFDTPTAYFSAMPGGLMEMMTLAEEYRADVLSVALVHSVRILTIVFSVPVIVRLIEGSGMAASGVAALSIADIALIDYGWIVVTAVIGVVVGYALRLPAVYLLGPLLVSAVIHAVGLSAFKLPVELVNLAQLVIGVSVGCRFSGIASATVFRILRIAFGMNLVLLAITALAALIATRFSEFGFVPVFLAYAPGGLPEMSLVAIALNIEVAFVAGHHIVRLFAVMVGAPLAYTFLNRSSSER